MSSDCSYCYPNQWEGLDFKEMAIAIHKKLKAKKQPDYWAVFDYNNKYIEETLSRTKKDAIHSLSIHEMDVIDDGGAGGIGNYQYIREMGFSVRKISLKPKYETTHH